MNEHQPSNIHEHLETAATRLTLADALAIIHPPTAQAVAEQAADSMILAAGALLMDKLATLGLTDSQIEALTLDDLLRLAPEEMAYIAEQRNRSLENAVTAIGTSALQNQIYATDRLLGKTKND